MSTKTGRAPAWLMPSPVAGLTLEHKQAVRARFRACGERSVIPLRDDNPIERTPLVTYALVAANVLAFCWQIGLPRVLGADDLLGADILEVGYNLRGYMPMEQHVARDLFVQ